MNTTRSAEATGTDEEPSTTAVEKVSERIDAGKPFSGRPTTVRFPTDLQKRLAVASQVTGMSMSELMREGAEYVVKRYVGADQQAVEATIEATARAQAQRMRELYGLDDGGS